jgi:hypothetical protein
LIRKAFIFLLTLASGIFALLWLVSWLTPLYVLPYDSKGDFIALAADMGMLEIVYSRTENGRTPKSRTRFAKFGVSWHAKYGMQKGGRTYHRRRCGVQSPGGTIRAKPLAPAPPTYRVDDTIRISILLISFVLAFVPLGHAGLAYRRRARLWRLGLCVGCEYDLSGNVSGVCPECGRPMPDDRADSAAASDSIP